MIRESELIINSDGSVYHLNAKPGELSPVIITVGDPDRVKMFEKHFDSIVHRIENREFRILTGKFKNRLISVLATGIGTDNIDIALNEIDALFNVDFQSRKLKSHFTQLHFIRIGTSGTIRENIPLDSVILSKYAVGFDGLLQFYSSFSHPHASLEQMINEQLDINASYAVKASDKLLDHFKTLGQKGITITSPGFYAPQSRSIRLEYKYNIIDSLSSIQYDGCNCTNIEMETSGIYGLSNLLGHEAISLNAILANRVTGAFSNQARETVHHLIDVALHYVHLL